MIELFIAIQISLFFFMILHDWIDFPPFTDLKALKKAHSFKFRLIGSIVNGGMVIIPLIITFLYMHSPLPLWTRIMFVSIYCLITFGTITAWWIPYFGGGYLLHGNKASLKNTEIRILFYLQGEITSYQIRFTVFCISRFGYVLGCRFIGFWSFRKEDRELLISFSSWGL